MITTIIFFAALGGLALIAFLVADGRRNADADRQRRLRTRARASQLHAEALAHETPAPEDDPAEQERAAIESRLEAERRRSALVETD